MHTVLQIFIYLFKLYSDMQLETKIQNPKSVSI